MSGDRGECSAKSWVPCVQSNVEAMFHLETDESCEIVGHGRSRGTSFVQLEFVVGEIQGFKIETFIMKHAVLDAGCG